MAWRSTAARDDLYVFVSLVVQFAFVVGRPRPRLAWWRVAAAFAVIPLLRPWDFWADSPRAVPRTMLALTLAFNVLVPRTRAGLALLLAGNLTALSARRTLDVEPVERTTFVDGITCDYQSGWYGLEHLGGRTWRWASGSALVTIHNPQAKSLPIVLEFDTQSRTERTLVVSLAEVHETIHFATTRPQHVRLGPVNLPPGDAALAFSTSEPPWTEPGAHGRGLAFSFQNLQITSAPRAE